MPVMVAGLTIYLSNYLSLYLARAVMPVLVAGLTIYLSNYLSLYLAGAVMPVLIAGFTIHLSNYISFYLAGAAMPVLIAGFATSSVGAATNIGKEYIVYTSVFILCRIYQGVREGTMDQIFNF